MATLLLLFVAVPAIELALLIEIGARIGTAATLALIVATGVFGAALARRQGLRALRAIRAALERGELPAGPLIDGVIILMAGALLVTPGVLTDAVGFACLVPGARNLAKRALERRFERAVREQRLQVTTAFFDARGGPIVDVTPDDEVEATPRSGGPDRLP